jgi:transposase
MRNRRTISLDLRERILAGYDEGEGTREDIAKRFRVSLGLVKKLLQQRRHTGDITARHHRAGRKPMLGAEHQRQFRTLLAEKPDLTLRELREVLSLKCSVQAIHVVLVKMGLSYKKRPSAPANRTAPISPAPGKDGGAGKRGWTRRA